MKLQIQVSAGRGPVECQWAAARVVEELTAEARSMGAEVRELERVAGERTDAILSARLEVEGEGIESWLSTWCGTVLWSATSPFRQIKRRNWYVGVQTQSATSTQTPTKINPEDLEIATYRSPGPGGQNVNKRSTAVRVKHVPSGLTAESHAERSQLRNREQAIAQLEAMLQARSEAEKARVAQAHHAQHDALERGNPVRTYVGGSFKRR
jgi:peptide chain release factor